MLKRRLGVLQAVSLNMSMMVGIGPFIAIPFLFARLEGPVAMLGWVIGAGVAVADGLVWSELAAAFPGSGGTYHFFDAIFGRSWLGRGLKFLFVWQFLFSGPLELASGMLGFADYASYLWNPLGDVVWHWDQSWPGNAPIFSVVIRRKNLLAMGATAGLVALAYRRVESAGRLMIWLWLGMLLAVSWVIVEGAFRFNAATAFDFPPGPLRINRAFVFGLGGTLGLAMYSYLGYYQVCYLGDEVVNPPRTMPGAIVISVLAVAGIYMSMTLGILGVIPWREASRSMTIASDFMLKLRGIPGAVAISLLVMWSAVASCFAGLLGYSRIPYAAARSGHFFQNLAHLHPKGEFPDRSLLLLGALTALACLGELGSVIEALLTSRILVQFVAQILIVVYLRSQPEFYARMPYRMVLYPLPAIVALFGWLWVFGTTSRVSISYGLASLVLGFLTFLGWDGATRRRTRAGAESVSER